MSDGKIVDIGGKPLSDGKDLLLPPSAQPEAKAEQIKLPPAVYAELVEYGDEVREAVTKRIDTMMARVEELGVKDIAELPEADKDTIALTVYLTLYVADWGAEAGVPPNLMSHLLALLNTHGEM